MKPTRDEILNAIKTGKKKSWDNSLGSCSSEYEADEVMKILKPKEEVAEYRWERMVDRRIDSLIYGPDRLVLSGRIKDFIRGLIKEFTEELKIEQESNGEYYAPYYGEFIRGKIVHTSINEVLNKWGIK